MHRRGFLATLAGFAAGTTLDPERLLWVPGRTLISIPAFHAQAFPVKVEPLSAEQMNMLFAEINSMIDRWSAEGLGDV